MKQKLYLECYSGISGDMLVAALLDLGASQETLDSVLESIPAHGFRTKISHVKKAGIDACDFEVQLDEEHENHDHDMQYLYGDMHEHHHNHEHRHEHEHHYNHEHHHEHRGLKEVMEIIAKTEMTEHARETAVRIFQILAAAEAKAHGTTMDEVHFHEVGAIDSIVDIIAIAVCLDNLGIEEVIVPVLYEGTGHVRCQHGVIPVPVPAVQAIVVEQKLPLHITSRQGELVTPTGAAAVAAIRTGSTLPAVFAIERTGLGAGKREYEIPSLVRAMLITEETKAQDVIWKLETNIDDCTGERLGYAMERLFAAGARDVHYIPVFMKKNRPAYQLNVICTEDKITELEQIIFEETTTIGIRRVQMERSILEREMRTVETSVGSVEVKVCTANGIVRYYPEYESVAELARQTNQPYKELYHLIERECVEGN